MPLYTFAKSVTELSTIRRTTFSDENVLEDDIQKALAKDISVLLDDVMVVCTERGFWQDASRRVDLLCIDTAANLLIVELKRDETAGHADLHMPR